MSRSQAQHRLLYRWIALLVVLLQLAAPISTAAASALLEPPQAPAADVPTSPRNTSLHRAAGESRDAFFMRVGQADPERLQRAALQALEDYLNHPAPMGALDDGFERLIERYLVFPQAAPSGAPDGVVVPLQIAGPPRSPAAAGRAPMPAALEPVAARHAAMDVPPMPDAATPGAPARAARAAIRAGETTPAPRAIATPAAAPRATAIYAAVAPVPAALRLSAADTPATAPAPSVLGTPVDDALAATVAPAATPAPALAADTPAPAEAATAAPAAPVATTEPTPIPLPTQAPAAVVTTEPAAAPGRETRTVGVIKIAADTFTDLGGGKTQATGNVVIGDYLPLLGGSDAVTYDAATLTATVTLALKVGSNQVNLFTGSFSAPISSGMATLGSDVSYSLSQVAGFPITGNLAISQLNLSTALVAGTASLHLNPPGVDTTAAANFTIAGGGDGITYAGSLLAFSLTAAGVTLSVPQGATIGNGGIQAPSVILALPATFGGLTTTVNSLEVTTSSLSLGGAQAGFALPELRIGGGASSSVRFTNNQATLTFDNPTQAYLLTIASTLALNLPGNTITAAVSVTLGAAGGQPVLTGALASLTLNVAGTSLAMTGLTIGNNGLTVAQATLTLPAQFGGASGTVTQISITQDGLSFGGATIALPDIKFGDGSRLKITGIQATLAQQNNTYVFTAGATLQINLPGNAKTVGLSMTLDGNGNLSGTVTGTGQTQGERGVQGGTTLNLAGGSLNLISPTVGNNGVSVQAATLTLPASLGSSSATVNNVSITMDGLSLGSATIAFPDVMIGDGSKVKITALSATMATAADGYTFALSGTLQVRLPGNSLDIAVTANIDTASNLSATVNQLTLNIAGVSLNMTGLTLNNSGLAVAQATLTLPAQFGGASGTVTQISITKDGLSFGSATIALPDIKFGDGSRLKITGIQATLAQQNNTYVFTAGATLQINLPGNAKAIGLSMSLDGNGNLSGTVTGTSQAQGGRGVQGGTTLNLAGASLNLVSPTVSNNGISVQAATLTLPASLGSSSATVTNVSISKDGLSLGSATITFPDIKIGDGSKVKITALSATMATAAGGYTFTLSGTLQVRLPGNSQDIAITASIDTASNLSATVSQLTLNIASISLKMTGLTLNNSGLTVSSAALSLPSKLGSASGSVSNVTITADGLKIGGATAQISFPDFKIGSTTGFAVTGVKATISITNNGAAYSVTLSGTIAINIPGNSASATGSVTVDNLGNISGSVQSFAVSIAGLSLSAQTIQIAADGSFSIASAKLALPAGFGGGYVQLNNVVIRPGGGTNAISIGGGSFQLPQIRTGGFTLQVSGSLQKMTNGYQISASGIFNMPSLGGAAGCSGIQVSVTLFDSTSGQTVLKIEPAPQPAATHQVISYPATHPTAMKLTQAAVTLNCSLPIGSTGFFMTSLSGSVTLDQNSTTVSVAVQIAAGEQVAGIAVASAQAQATVTADPFSLALSGTIKIFTFAVGGASASIKPNQFSATLWINEVVLQGQVTVNAWSDTNGFHLSGSATMNVGIPKSSIYQSCWSWRCCPNGSAYKGYNCWPWKTHSCSTCINIPPSDWNFGNAAIQVGEFSTPSSGYAWGFKGQVTILGYTAAFYVDTNGTIKVGGDVNQYKLLTPSQIQAARLRWTAALATGAVQAGADWIDHETGVVFTADGEILVPVEVDNPRHVSFALTRFGAAPGLELIRPDGVRVTPQNLPANITYTEFVTYTVAGELSVAQAAVARADLAPIQAASTTATVRGSEVQDLVLANRFASRAGVGPAVSSAAGENRSAETAASAARLRFVHAVAEIPAVDVRLDDAPLFSNIAYGAATAYISVTAQSHIVSIVPAGAAGPELARVTADLAADTDTSAVAIGRAAAPALLALTDDNARGAAGKARVRVVHASADAPAVDLAADADSPLLFGTGYASASATVPVTAGVHDLHVRASGTTDDLVVVPAVPLADGRVYTVFLLGLAETETGPYTLQVVLSQDAAPAGRVRFIHSVQAAANLNLLLDGQPLFTDVPFVSDPNAAQGPYTQYATVAPGQHVLAVTAAEAPTVPLGVLPLAIVSDQDTTAVAVPIAAAAQTDPAQEPVSLWSTVDDNALPAAGQARLRLIHAWAQPAALDLAVSGGAILIRGLARNSASDYITLPGGAYALEVRDTATGAVLVTLPAETLQDGLVYSAIVRGSGPAPSAEIVADQVALRTIQMAYEVDAPMTGVWQAALTGNIAEDDQYVLTATGALADATLSGVTATPLPSNMARIGWQLVSTQVTTTVSIFANPGPITTTQVLTTSEGITATVTVPLYVGHNVADKLSGPPPGWNNGSPQAQMVDLNSLPSAAYHIWVQADDARTRPARMYAADVITISHPWAAAWAAHLAVTPAYRALDIAWDRHPNPDVDRYQLKLGAQSGVADQSVDVGIALTYSFTGLDPARQYFIWLEGVDNETGRVSSSEVLQAMPLAAPFTLSGPITAMPIIAGQTLTVTLTLTTTEVAYPDGVVLSAGCSSAATNGQRVAVGARAAPAGCSSVPDGIAVQLPDRAITPTLAGAETSLIIHTASTLPDGSYNVPIVARGGGLERQLILPVAARQPSFRLIGPLTESVLMENATIKVPITADGSDGATDEITLELTGTPSGLVWAFDNPVIRPGQGAILTFTDTELLESGVYPLRIVGRDGRVTGELARNLKVREPKFVIAAQPTQRNGMAGQEGRAPYELDLSSRDGWTTPVTLRVADAAPPPGGRLWLSSEPGANSGVPTLTVQPDSRVYAIAGWTADTPPGLYLFTVTAVSGAQTTQVDLAVRIGSALRQYLPLIVKPGPVK